MPAESLPVGGLVPPGTVAVNQATLAEYGPTLSEALRTYGEQHALTYLITFHFPDAHYALFVPAEHQLTASSDA